MTGVGHMRAVGVELATLQYFVYTPTRYKCRAARTLKTLEANPSWSLS